jgi:hypothetical protein
MRLVEAAGVSQLPREQLDLQVAVAEGQEISRQVRVDPAVTAVQVREGLGDNHVTA